MSRQNDRDDGSLVQTGRRDLASVAGANPLVLRGLDDIAQRTDGLWRIEDSKLILQRGIAHYLRGVDCYVDNKDIEANKELDEAIRILSEVIRLDPRNPIAFRHRAKAYWCKTEVDWVMRHDSSQVKSECNLSAEDYSGKAMNDFDEAIQINPKDAIVFVERGEVWCGKGCFDNRIKDLSEAIRLNPTNAGWYCLRGLARRSLKQYDHAIRDFEEAIRLTGSLESELGCEVLIVFTPTEREVSRYDAIVDKLSLFGCVWVDPCEDLGEAYFKRGETLLEEKEYDKAIIDFSEAIRLNDGCYINYCLRGDAWAAKNEYDRSIEDFDVAIQINPKIARAYSSRGYAWLAKEVYDKAIRDFDEAIRLQPKCSYLYNGRAYAWFDKKEYDKAIHDLDESIRLQPTNPHSFLSRGRARTAKGWYNGAFADYDEAIRLDPSDPMPYFFRGLGKWHKGVCDSVI